MKAIAAKLKLRAEKVDKAVREAVLKGYLTTADIIKSVKEFYENEVLTKKCEDFLPNNVSVNENDEMSMCMKQIEMEWNLPKCFEICSII